MRLFIVSVRDSAADSYHAPLHFPALGLAERWFRDECLSTNPENLLAKHPSDFDLFTLGTFESETAEITVETPRLILRGAEIKRVNGA